MILIGIGSNLPSRYGDSAATVMAAIAILDNVPVRVIARSSLWKTAPVPVSDQAWYVNAVVAIETSLPPDALLHHLHDMEAAFGRERHEVNAARVLDLDIVDYHGIVSLAGSTPLLPHPRLQTRAFVLLPLAEIARDWAHPVSNVSVQELIARLPAEQEAIKLTAPS